MAIQTIIFITLALLAALGFSFLQYLFRKKPVRKKDYIFFSLRALAIFLVLLLLINPKIVSTEFELEKPELVLLVDNSASVKFLNAEESAQNIITNLRNSEEIRKNFELRVVPFGSELNASDTLGFSEGQSDIYRALEESYGLSEKRTAVLLLSDGNQNIGRDFKYFEVPENSTILPVILGDTTTYTDLRIDRVNVNRYAFLNNKFPVEIFSSYSGAAKTKAEVRIKNGTQVVFKENREFSPQAASQIINAEIPANSIGLKRYTVEIDIVEGEKNTNNNQLNFAIEVIDERTSVLILSELAHPDLGALKKSIESNEQRVADIKYLKDNNLQLKEYQLVVLYQVNQRFNSVIKEIISENLNIFFISGSETDWDYVNQLELGVRRNSTNQPQDAFPVLNENFSSFQFEDIGFDDFPPLVDRFGPLEFDTDQLDVLLFQKIQGVETGEPLMAVSRTTPKSGFLLGENIWRWRAKSYVDTKSFADFDEFIGKLIQNLSSGQRRERLTVETENFYYENQDVIIKAEYFDQNYRFDANASLNIKITDSSKTNTITSGLINKNNFYQVNSGNLPAGTYDYSVSVSGENISKSGSFEVIDYNLEQQNSSANLEAMQQFARNNNSNLFFADNFNKIRESLLNDESLKPVQKSRQKTVPLVDWYYLLFILVFFLTIEWFYRKYLGLI